MLKIIKCTDISALRRVIKLKKELIDARARWEEMVKANCIKKKIIKGDVKRSPNKTLYVSTIGKWSIDMQEEMHVFAGRIKRLKFVGAKKPRSLWMPTTIENPKSLHIKIYLAASVRTVTKPQANSFARKAKFDGTIPNCSIYKIRSDSARCYKLQVVRSDGGICYVGFTEWTVCLCKPKLAIPKLFVGEDNSTIEEIEYGGAICAHGHSALFAGND
jgi:hypothetical protein